MFIKKIELETDKLESLKSFYTQVLGFELIESNENSFFV